jgi:hypothetical protein
MLLDINEAAKLWYGGAVPKKKSRSVLASTRRFISRRKLGPAGQEVRICPDGKSRLMILWDENALQTELARYAPRGLAAASPETRARVCRARQSSREK